MLACIQAGEMNFEADALAKDGMHCESLFVELVTVLALFSSFTFKRNLAI